MTERLADPWRELDAQPDVAQMIEGLEVRGEAPSHRRLRRRFLRFAGVRRGDTVLEVGSGSGVVARDLAAMVGARGRVLGLDASRTCVAVSRRLARAHGVDGALSFRVGDAARLPFRGGRFDVSLAVTLLLHVDAPAGVVAEMARVTRRGGVVGVQDQDFGTVVVAHPDQSLTSRILDGVAAHMYPEPHSGRRLPELLHGAGLRHVELLTDVYQDTTLEPWTRRFLERRAENAVQIGLVGADDAQRWLHGATELAGAGAFVMTMNYYGVTGIKP